MPTMPGFTEADLRELAGARSFERGLGYGGQVSGLAVTGTGSTGTEITATVSGTDDYDVWLAPGDQGLQGDCSCPFGREGFFCKHCVAVGLAMLEPGARDQVSATRARRDSVEHWLGSLSRSDLLAELRGLLASDHDLRRRFELRAAAAGGDTLAIRRTTRELITPRRGGYLAHDEADAPYGIAPDLSDYAGLLGAAGLRRLRQRITAAGAGQPADPRLMESLLRAEGNVDGVVALRAASLDDRGWGHLAIADELDHADRGDEAPDWAERGLREARHPDGRLVEYLAERYAAAYRPGDVLTLRRDRFAADPTLAAYQKLRQAATAARRWPAERQPALGRLAAEARIGRPRAAGALDWTGPVLIDALLDDGETDAAWTAAAAAPDDTSPAQWLRLADLVAAARPADALAVYLRLIKPLRSHTGDKIYEQAARLLRGARACHQALGTAAEFERCLALFRADQRRKPSLMRLLDRHGLTARAGP